MKASDVPVPVSKVAAKQEVVPIHYNELPETKAVSTKNGADSVAIRLEYRKRYIKQRIVETDMQDSPTMDGYKRL